MDRQTHRQHKLQQLIDEVAGGRQSKLAEMVDIASTSISRMLYPKGKAGAKAITEKTTDKIERLLNLPIGWFDTEIIDSVNQANRRPLTQAEQQHAKNLAVITKQWQDDRKKRKERWGIEAIAESLNISQSAFSQFKDGKVAPNLKKWGEICRFFNIPLSDIGEDLAEEAEKLTNTVTVTSSVIGKSDDLFIPIRNATASMGHGMVASEFEMVVDEIKVSRTWLRRELPQITSLSNLQIIAGIGDSMSPTYDSGDLLLVDTGVKEVLSDLIYVFSYKGSTYVKRIFIDPVTSTIQVKSDNPNASNWQPLSMEDMDDFTIHGRVVYAWKGFKL